MKRIAVERKARGLTRSQLGFEARVHPSRCGAIELGRYVPPDNSIELGRIAKALQWRGRPAELLEEVETGAAV